MRFAKYIIAVFFASLFFLSDGQIVFSTTATKIHWFIISPMDSLIDTIPKNIHTTYFRFLPSANDTFGYITVQDDSRHTGTFNFLQTSYSSNQDCYDAIINFTSDKYRLGSQPQYRKNHFGFQDARESLSQSGAASGEVMVWRDTSWIAGYGAIDCDSINNCIDTSLLPYYHDLTSVDDTTFTLNTLTGRTDTIVFVSGATTFANTAWSLTGNAGTDPNVNFLGTTDDVDLSISRLNTPIIKLTKQHPINKNGAFQFTVVDSFGVPIINTGTGGWTDAWAIGIGDYTSTYNGTYLVVDDKSKRIVMVDSSTEIYGKVFITGSVQVVDGTQGAGKVLTSDASGNASWQAPIYGEMGFGDSSVTVVLTQNNWSKVTNTTNNLWESSATYLDGITYSGDSLIIGTSGIYDMHGLLSLQGNNGSYLHLKVYRNGTALNEAVSINQLTANRAITMVMSELHELTAGDVIEVYVMNSADNNDIVAISGQLSIHLIKKQ